MFSEADVQELKAAFGEIYTVEEAGVTYFLIPGLPIAGTPNPDLRVDVLLCPTPIMGYPSRLFFAQVIPTTQQRNWNAQNVRIAERNWFAFSWKVERPGLRLAEMVASHLQGVR